MMYCSCLTSSRQPIVQLGVVPAPTLATMGGGLLLTNIALAISHTLLLVYVVHCWSRNPGPAGPAEAFLRQQHVAETPLTLMMVMTMTMTMAMTMRIKMTATRMTMAMLMTTPMMTDDDDDLC